MRRSGGGFAELADQQPEGAERLLARHHLLEAGGRQRLEHRVGPPDPQVAVAAVRLGDHRVPRLEAVEVVVLAEEAGQVVEDPLGPVAPGPGRHLGALRDDLEQRGARSASGSSAGGSRPGSGGSGSPAPRLCSPSRTLSIGTRSRTRCRVRPLAEVLISEREPMPPGRRGPPRRSRPARSGRSRSRGARRATRHRPGCPARPRRGRGPRRCARRAASSSAQARVATPRPRADGTTW